MTHSASADPRERTDACVDDETLRRWGRAELDADRIAAIDDHLEHCDLCAARLDALEPDPLVAQLREAARPASPQAEARDANLVFGALALQAGLITAQQFAEATVLWSAREGARLADVLEQAGWLTSEEREAVELLLAKRGVPSTAAPTLRGGDPGPSAVGNVAPIAQLPAGGGKLQLRSLHSAGGIGQVWRAYDALLDREVALKELLPELRGSRIHRERFLREARVAAQLAHPGTAPVHEYREEAGRCYYTMKFLAGRTLAEVARDAHSGLANDADDSFERLFGLLEHFLSVCDTIAYAHARGVIHRDLKGDNIIVGEFGEVTVLDWGLAKRIDGEPTTSGESSVFTEAPTLEGERLGTPGFMAPEQARGALGEIDEQTDVYGLAAVLYEVLTGRAPFAGTTANETMHLVETAEPAAPSAVRPGTPIELDAICLRGLAKAKSERYESAASIGGAVRQWIATQAAHAAEAEQQARFFSLSRDLFVTLSPDGAITHVNRAYLELLGYDDEGPLGRHYADTLHDEDRDRAARVFAGAQRGDAEQDFVVRVQRHSGGYAPISWSVTRAADEPMVYAVGRPLDEQSELRRRISELGAFFSLSRELLAAFDGDGKIVHTNPAYQEFFGYAEERIIGKSYDAKLHPDDLQRATDGVLAAHRGEAVEDLVVRVQRADDVYCPVSWTITKVPGQPLIYALGRPLAESGEGS